MKRFAVLALSALALSACTTVATNGAAAPSGPAAIPTSAIELGDWRNATPAATLQAFQQTINARYGVGLELSAVTADMRRNEFNCAAPDPGHGRGDPPAQVCRRTVSANGCTHTWQAHLYDEGDSNRLARTRGLYDRRCGGDGLLGGPG